MRTRTTMTMILAAACLVAACRRAPEPASPEPPTHDVTSWTAQTELFMEHPPLVAGQTTRFAVHLTKLADFSALNAGRPSIELTPESGGAPTTLPGTEALRPGAFRVEGSLPNAGRYRWALLVNAPSLSDRHDLGITTVFGNESAAVAEAEKSPPGDPAAIAYLKEQQWTNAFATEVIREAELRSALRAPATIQPLTGGDAIVAAPASGRFAAETLLAIGAMVRAGQPIGRIEPRSTTSVDRATLEADVAEAQAAVEATRAEAARAERLLAERAVPARRVEDAKRAVTVAEARATAARARLTQRDETLRTGGGGATGNSFVLRAPIGGRIAAVMATLGASFEEGAPLFRIVRTDRVELHALVSAADAPFTRDVDSIALDLPGRPDPFVVRPRHRHDSGVIDPVTRALTVQFEVDNRGGQLLIGQTATASLYTRARQRVPVAPKNAVLMEAGRPYVFVQLTGERFARRFVEIGARDGNLIGLRSGVRTGERVVTQGAYEVQLASAAKGLSAEGHVH